MTALDLRLAVPVAIGWAAAAITTARAGLALVLALGAAAVLGMGARRRTAPAALATAACVLACCGSLWVHDRALRAEPVRGLAADRAVASVELVLQGDPVRVRGRVVGAGRGADGVRVQATLTRVEARGRTTAVHLPVSVTATDQRWLGWLPGQRVRVRARLGLPTQPGTAATLAADGGAQAIGRPPLHQRAAGVIRAGVRQAAGVLPDRQAGLLPGLVVGDTSRLDDQLRDDVRTTGLSHLVAVSGANLAIVLGLALGLARRMRAGPGACVGVSVVLVAMFVTVARPSPSVLRAAVMGLVTALALGLGRRGQAMPVLSAAALVLLVLDPWMARSPGFALSVLATAGIVVAGPPLRERLARRLPALLADAVAVPLAGQAACTPVLAAMTGSVGLLAVPANVLVAPVVAPVTAIGMLIAATAWWALPVAQLLARAAGLGCWWLTAVATTGAQVPGASLPWWSGPWGGASAVLLVAGAAVALARRLSRRVLLAGTAAFYCSVLLVVPVAVPSWPRSDWSLAVCDVGQGDALVARAGTHVLLVDTGPDPQALHTCLVALGVRAFDAVVLTHLHADHVEGLPAVLGRLPVGEVEIGPLLEPAGEWQRVQEWASRAGVPLRPMAAGDDVVAGGLRWQVLGPRAAFHGTDSDPNNSSLVLRLTTPELTALLTGDAEQQAQQALLATGVDLAADVLKVPHHGSQKQDPAFLDRARAGVSIASVGAGNPYGHPSAQTLGRLALGGATVLRTDRNGSVALARRAGRLVVEPVRRGAAAPLTGALPSRPPWGQGLWCGERPPSAARERLVL